MHEHSIKIVHYEPIYKEAYRDLNVEWITKYFKLELADYKVLDNPEINVLDKGGQILLALIDNVPMGVCALLKLRDHTYDYELAKMAVSPLAQGNGVGLALGLAIIQKAKEAGAKSLYLESNTILTPAINLYRKLGFVEVAGDPSPYERANIKMALMLA